MRIYAVCERCGARTEVHRIGHRTDLRFDHMCDDAEHRAVTGAQAKGPIHTCDLAHGVPARQPVF